MVEFKRAESEEELKQILQLQKANLPWELSSEVRERDGFVTVQHSLELLDRMNRSFAHFIAKSDNKVIGYALSMHPDFKNEIEVLRPMFSEIRKYYPNDNYMVMGQICIDSAFRRKGIFRSLYNEMLEGIQPDFSTIITEVDLENTRSLNAHYSIGFKPICKYHSSDHDWALIKLESNSD